MDSNKDTFFLEAIEILSQFSDGHLATSLAEECKEFVKSYPHEKTEELKFLRNLRDKAVFCGGASNLIMQTFNILLSKYPESEHEKNIRHEQLEREYM